MINRYTARNIWIIFRKELLTILRDKTTLFMMIILPIVLYPVMVLLSSFFMMQSHQKMTEIQYEIAVYQFPDKLNPPLIFDTAEINLHWYNSSRLDTAEITAGTIDAAIVFPQDFSSRTTAEISIIFRASVDRSNYAMSKISAELEPWVKEYRREFLHQNFGLNVEDVEPVTITSRNISSDQEMTGFLAGMVIPFILIMYATIGAFYPALDLTTGEKTNRTLETLLTVPVSSLAIMAGKFLCVLFLTLLSIGLNILSLLITYTHGIKLFERQLENLPGMFNLSISLGVTDALLVLAAMIPFAVLLTALMMTVSIFARNFQEAQNFATPLLMLLMIPPAVTFLPGYTLSGAFTLLPIVNLALFFKELLAGSLTLGPALIVLGSTTIYALVLLVIAAWVFTREEILFRHSETVFDFYFISRNPINWSQAAWLTIPVFLIAMILLYYFGSLWQTNNLVYGLIKTQILIAVIALVFSKILKLTPRHLSLNRWASRQDFFRALILALSGLVVVVIISSIQQKLLDLDLSHFEPIIKQMINQSGASLVIMALAFTVMPAFCEELLFRGFFQGIYIRFKNPLSGILLTGFIFGLFHLDPTRLLSTTLIGCYIGLVVAATGSIWPGVLMHFINNSIAVSLARLAPSVTSVSESSTPSIESALLLILIFIGAPLVFWFQIRHFYRRLPAIAK